MSVLQRWKHVPIKTSTGFIGRLVLMIVISLMRTAYFFGRTNKSTTSQTPHENFKTHDVSKNTKTMCTRMLVLRWGRGYSHMKWSSN